MKRCVVAVFVAGVMAVSSLAADLPTVGSGTLMVWLDAGVGVTVDNGQIMRWENQAVDSVFGIDAFSKSAGADGPTLGALSNGTPVVHFDGNILRASLPNDTNDDVSPRQGVEGPDLQEWTFFFVLANVTDTAGLFDSAHNQQRPIRFYRSNYVAKQGDDDNGHVGGISIELPEDTSGGMMFSFSHGVVDGSRTWDGYVNGGGYEGSFNDEGGYTLVRWFEPQLGGINGGEAGWFRGDIAEVMIFQGVLSDADRKAVESYLAAKYDIAVVPEPAAMSLLALGGLSLLRRRR